MLIVSSAANDTNLTTVAAVKTELNITADTYDDWIETQISVASQMICNYLNVVPADNGTCTIISETLVETFRVHHSRYLSRRLDSERTQYLILSRRPIANIESVVQDGVTLSPSEYEVDGAGVLKHLASDGPTDWNGNKIVVTYTAGWIHPETDGANLPADIQSAAISLVKSAWFSKGRDPNVKSEDVPGVRQVEYFFRAAGSEAPLPDEVTQKIDRYRQVNI